MYSPVNDAQDYRDKRLEKHLNRSLVPPCQATCPLHMDIREYVDLVAQGRIMEALQVIRNDNPFPSICAYVSCPGKLIYGISLRCSKKA